MHPIPCFRAPWPRGSGYRVETIWRTFPPSKYITMPNFTQIGQTVWISIRYVPFLFRTEREFRILFNRHVLSWGLFITRIGTGNLFNSYATERNGNSFQHVMSWGLFFTRIGTGNLFKRLLLLLKGSLYSKQISRSVPCNKEVLTFEQTNPFLSV